MEQKMGEEDERKLKNLATRIMSNGVEVLVKDKEADMKPEQRQLRLMHITSLKPQHLASSSARKSLLSSAVATVVSRQQFSAMFPLHQLMRHNYIIKTCMTTYTYLTTVVQNKRSAISTFETIVSVVTTETLTNPYLTDMAAEIKPTKTKYMEVKTIQPSTPSHIFMSNLPKIDKRIDEDESLHKFDYIEPSEVGHASCTTTSCSCSHTKTEGLKTKYTNLHGVPASNFGKYPMKTTKFGLGPKPSKDSVDKTKYPYEYENGLKVAPTDKIVEKYTEVVNDYSDEKNPSSVEESELLTNEQAPRPPKPNKVPGKKPDKVVQKPNKNKFVGDLIKLGSLGIKGLSQLAPVFEKMTGGFIKRYDTNNINKTTTTTSTIKPIEKLTSYNVDKRVDSDVNTKNGQNFPIYIPVDELETSESQNFYSNVTLHQNLAWAAEHNKHSKAHNILPPKIIHESPLVNGGIPISPGEIITANSDVIVGKPAVGGPLTLGASGVKLQHHVKSPSYDSHHSGSEHHIVKEIPLINEQSILDSKTDDSYDLRPPNLPKEKPIRHLPPPISNFEQYYKKSKGEHKFSPRPSSIPHMNRESMMKTEHLKSHNIILGNHGRPAFLDYIPSLAKPSKKPLTESQFDFGSITEMLTDEEIPDNSPSSSEISSTRVKTEPEYPLNLPEPLNKPFLVDIQPSKVANVLIPHGSSTALVFAGSSEPHKTGEYIDDPLPYPEPGYFGSFSIDAPQMTNVHVAPNSHPFVNSNNPTNTDFSAHMNQSLRLDSKQKSKPYKRPEYYKISPPTSNFETHMQVGPHITVYNPDAYKGDFESHNNNKPKKEQKNVIDKDYENYLAVPPPPPPSKHNIEKNNKPYQQLPVVHTQPIQDMKIFMNIQHPVPYGHSNAAVTPKITSEVYFAEQAQNGKPTPTYTIRMPPRGNTYEKHFYNQQNNYKTGTNNAQSNPYQNFPSSQILFSPNSNKTIPKNEISHGETTYSVTLNTATNLASNSDTRSPIGTSVPVPVGSNNSGSENTDIPIGTNFAIKVDDGFSIYDASVKTDENTNIVYSNPSPVLETTIGNNTWIKELNEEKGNYFEEHKENRDKLKEKDESQNDSVSTPNEIIPSIAPSINSHANFPMINEQLTSSSDVAFSENAEDSKDRKRPAKLIPNIASNSHGWYSSVFKEDSLKNMNSIKIEGTTQKGIPLKFDYDKNIVPNFGEKITSVGKPPNDFWSLNTAKIHTNNFNIGKPFSKASELLNPKPPALSASTKPFITEASINYIPSNIGHIDQPVYDIPIRDNSDETTTTKIEKNTENLKPVYENAEEVIDGEEEIVSEGDLDGEVSQESMSVHVVTASTEKNVDSEKTNGTNLLKDGVLLTDNEINKNTNLINFDPNTQTEKPFTYNSTNTYHSNNMNPIYNYNHTKPRPFTISNLPPIIDHQLHQPHWQINQLMVNSTNMSYEEGLDLNIGEEMSTVSTTKASTSKLPYRYNEAVNKYKRPRPESFRPNNDSRQNTSSNIITSTVHIRDRKPLIIKETQEKSTLPTFTITSESKIYNSSTDIIDLSPPPPTMDFNFKPSTNDETIMGMSPPPPRTPPSIRIPPRMPHTPNPMLSIRTPPPYRTKPPRTFSPRPATQRPTRKPIRDDVSTYRPAYDILNSIKRPNFNQDQPSPVLLPPPNTELPDVSLIDNKPSSLLSGSHIVFPTPISSGWLTSSTVGFSSSFNFAPTPVYLPEITESTKQVTPDDTQDYKISTSSEKYNSGEDSSSERVTDTRSEETSLNDSQGFSDEYIEPERNISTEASTTTNNILNTKLNYYDTSLSEQKDVSTERVSVIPLGYKNRTRKPYPYPQQNKNERNRYTQKPYTKTPLTARPQTRPEIMYPTRPTPIRKIVRPVTKQASTTSTESVIESSETFIDDDFVKPTEVLNIEKVSKISKPDMTTISHNSDYTATTIVEEGSLTNKPVHHAGNEVKISDEIIPTKTEFRTTVVTLTKTLSEPPKTISSLGYINLTHTLTVTHTETSLISTSEGAVTQTLMITNTHTSTIVDVITEVHTQVQPTTIIETVTKHIPVPQVEPTPVQTQNTVVSTKNNVIPLDDITMSSEETDSFIIKNTATTENVQKVVTEDEGDNDTFLIVMNKSQNGGKYTPVTTDIDTGDYDHITRNEQVNSNGVSQVLFGEILLAGTPYLETTNVAHSTGVGFGKECQPDCKASRNERCQRIDGIMKCVCRPGFARMFPDRPCKPTYTYSVRLALRSQGNEILQFQKSLSDNSSKEYHDLALATHEGINRMIMQSDLRDVYHGVHITGFQPVEMKKDNGENFQGVINDFYVQLSDNAHESRLKEVIEKYLRNNNYSLGGTNVHAAGELMEKLEVSDFDECTSGQFHDCSEHAQCFNLRGTYTCSCLEGFADLSVNKLYPGRICSAEPVGCERCNYHGACYSRDDRRVLCECFQWYSGSSCHINLKVVLISLVVAGALLAAILAACAVIACTKRQRPPPRSVLACIHRAPSHHQVAVPFHSKQRADKRALISERADSGDASSLQNASLPYMPTAKRSSSRTKQCKMSSPPAHEAPPPPPPAAVMIPRARLHDTRDNLARKKSLELSNEAKLISYLESGGVVNANEEMRRKHSMESSYSAPKDRHNKQGALVSAGFKVSTTIRPDEQMMKEDRDKDRDRERARERERDRDRDDLSSINKADLEAEMSRFDSLRKRYSQEDMSEWTDAERRLGELTLSEARSVGGTLPASTGRAASSTRLTHQEANTMAERDLGSTFLLPHVHLYKPEITSDVSEFDSL